jgi:Ser/Thr protein kinase RdoA (MazF antagonist)
MRVKSSDEIDAATVARWLAQDWALPGVTVVPHHGGMNSRTWIVSRDPSHWIAKAVPSAEGRNLSAGLSLATRVQAAGIPAGAPLTTPDGRPTVTRHGWTLALLTFVDGAGLIGKVESEQRLIGATLAAAHGALAGLDLPDVDRFHWLDPDASHLGIRRWIRPAIVGALASWEHLPPSSLTWGLLHTDPAPEAFRFEDAAGICGLIDWDRALVGPLMYDLASAVMYVGGPRNGASLVDAYLARGGLGRDEVERTMLPMLRFRWAVQADYFAHRVAASDMIGIDDESDNEKGLEDARRGLSGW